MAMLKALSETEAFKFREFTIDINFETRNRTFKRMKGSLRYFINLKDKPLNLTNS